MLLTFPQEYINAEKVAQNQESAYFSSAAVTEITTERQKLYPGSIYWFMWVFLHMSAWIWSKPCVETDYKSEKVSLKAI